MNSYFLNNACGQLACTPRIITNCLSFVVCCCDLLSIIFPWNQCNSCAYFGGYTRRCDKTKVLKWFKTDNTFLNLNLNFWTKGYFYVNTLVLFSKKVVVSELNHYKFHGTKMPSREYFIIYGKKWRMRVIVLTRIFISEACWN